VVEGWIPVQRAVIHLHVQVKISVL